MKKYICILAGAALFVACEQKTETVAPAPAADKTEHNTTIVNPTPAGATKSETNTTNTTNVLSSSPSGGTKTESSTSTTTSTPSGH